MRGWTEGVCTWGEWDILTGFSKVLKSLIPPLRWPLDKNRSESCPQSTWLSQGDFQNQMEPLEVMCSMAQKGPGGPESLQGLVWDHKAMMGRIASGNTEGREGFISSGTYSTAKILGVITDIFNSYYVMKRKCIPSTAPEVFTCIISAHTKFPFLQMWKDALPKVKQLERGRAGIRIQVFLMPKPKFSCDTRLMIFSAYLGTWGNNPENKPLSFLSDWAGQADNTNGQTWAPGHLSNPIHPDPQDTMRDEAHVGE